MDGKLTRRAFQTTQKIHHPAPAGTPGVGSRLSRLSAQNTSIKGGDLIRVLVVDDHELVRVGLLALLGQGENIEVVGEAATVGAAVAEARRLKPHIVLMDLRLPDGNGIEACRTIRADGPDTRVLILTVFPDDDAVVSAFRAGASGFLLKETSGQDLIRAIETVVKGQSILDPAVTQGVLTCSFSQSAATKQHAWEKLSAQQQRVMELVAGGKTNKEVATALGLSDKTVKNYLRHTCKKLQVSNRTQATASFLRLLRGASGLSNAELGWPRRPALSH